jgi:hypothetical protein
VNHPEVREIQRHRPEHQPLPHIAHGSPERL